MTRFKVPQQKSKKPEYKKIWKEFKHGFKVGAKRGYRLAWKNMEWEVPAPKYARTNGRKVGVYEFTSQRSADKRAMKLKREGYPVRVEAERKYFLGAWRDEPRWVWSVYYSPSKKPFGKHWEKRKGLRRFISPVKMPSPYKVATPPVVRRITGWKNYPF